MNEKDQAALDTLLAAMKAEFTAQLQPLVDKIIELEGRSSNFAARVSSHNACYRSEIQVLRAEIAALKGDRRFAPSPVRISTEAWDAAHAELCALHPGRKYFPANEVRAQAALLVAQEAEFAL